MSQIINKYGGFHKNVISDLPSSLEKNADKNLDGLEKCKFCIYIYIYILQLCCVVCLFVFDSVCLEYGGGAVLASPEKCALIQISLLL